jgi:decaprenylphospho-beta-D-erythro-pentofuranosid-2-ulose 2-reductase
MKTRIVIIGATSAIAEHCARQWLAATPAELILVGRDLAKIELVAADLRVRSPQSTIHSIKANFTDPLSIKALVDSIVDTGPVDTVLIAHGSLADQQQCQHDLTQCQDALAVNGVSPVLFAEAFAAHMQRANAGTLALIGSVAGDRGRKSNYVYGAAKGLVTRYAQGLQHRFADSKVKVVLIKPGPTDTPMTAQLKNQGAQLADVDAVARQIVAGIKAGRTVIYAPAKWAVIMLVIRHLPRFVFNKMNI